MYIESPNGGLAKHRPNIYALYATTASAFQDIQGEIIGAQHGVHTVDLLHAAIRLPRHGRIQTLLSPAQSYGGLSTGVLAVF